MDHFRLLKNVIIDQPLIMKTKEDLQWPRITIKSDHWSSILALEGIISKSIDTHDGQI